MGSGTGGRRPGPRTLVECLFFGQEQHPKLPRVVVTHRQLTRRRWPPLAGWAEQAYFLQPPAAWPPAATGVSVALQEPGLKQPDLQQSPSTQNASVRVTTLMSQPRGSLTQGVRSPRRVAHRRITPLEDHSPPGSLSRLVFNFRQTRCNYIPTPLPETNWMNPSGSPTSLSQV